MRWLVSCGVVVAAGIESAAAQRRLPWTAPPPALALGERVRVSTWEPGFPAFGSSPFAGTREVRLAGTLIAYSPLDSVRVARTGAVTLFSTTPERTVYWSTVSQIDVPNGRNTLAGAAGGLGGAFGLALLGALGERVLGCQYEHNCGSVWKATARLALYTVPVGTVFGFFSTRWRRVY